MTLVVDIRNIGRGENMKHSIQTIDIEDLEDVNAGGICWAGVGAAIASVCAGSAIACAAVASGGVVPAAVALIYLASIACSAGATYEGCK